MTCIHSLMILVGILASTSELLADDVNGKNPQGRTALMEAAMKGDSPSCETLLNKGADVNASIGNTNSNLQDRLETE